MTARIRCASATLAGVALLGLLHFASAAHGHALLHQVERGPAITVTLYFADDDRPIFEPYQVFAPGSDTAFQTGRVNAAGELSFRPDRTGEWRVQVATADGHGARILVQIDDTAAFENGVISPDRRARGLAALGYLLGIFGVLALWRLHQTTRGRP